MGANFPSIIFAQGYTDQSIQGLGAVKGASCTIKNITQDSNKNNNVVFEWTGADGVTKQTSTMTVPAGVSVTGWTSIDDTHFVWDFSDGTQSPQMTIPEQIINVSADAGNLFEKKADGYFVGHDDEKLDVQQQVTDAGKVMTVGPDGKVIPDEVDINISADSGNALVKKPDGYYVGSTGVQISQQADNAIEEKPDGLFVEKSSDVKVSSKANNAIEEVTDPGEEGIFVDITGKVDKVAGKELILSTLIPKITDNETHIGDVTTIAITSVTDLVSYCNILYNSFMASITYANKEVIITYRNGATVKIDVSAIITDTNIGELNNVDDTGITDGQVLHYEAASQKYKPHTIDLAKVLADAKAYTDEIAAALDKKKAEIVDEEPIYDASGEKPIITYKQNGETKTTDDVDMWFYYTADGKTTQVIWINGVELKLAVDNAADFSDLVSKSKDVVSTYTGEELDKTKIPDLAALDALKALVDNELSNKVNTDDIVDNLASDAVDKPLSAAQGKALDSNKLDKKTDASNAHKVVVVDEEGNLIFGEAGVQVSAATGNTIETKADGIFVEAEIHEVTEAEYEAMSEAEREGKNWLIKDKTPQTIDKYLIDDNKLSGQNAWSAKKVDEKLGEINDSLVDIEQEAGNVYSTEETVCGKWIDGKKIYRRVLSKVVTSSANFTYTETISNFGRLIRCDILTIGNNNVNQEVNMYYNVRASISNNVATFSASPTAMYTLSGTQYLVIEYTKTTD